MMDAVVDVVLLCLAVGSVGGVVRTFVDVVYRWLWLFRWKTKVDIIFDNTVKCGKARRIQKLQVYCYYMCIALTLQPYVSFYCNSWI